MVRSLIVSLSLALLPRVAAAQEWNTPEVRELVRRAILAREAPDPDSTLRHWRSRAHGFVFSLAQFGRGFPVPPRLAKADELDVEVYWEAPNRSKQRIVAWRDGTFLPYTVRYHRDHLGIVTNNYGPLIRIGEGDEVRDAVHPLSVGGPDYYDFALADTLTLRSGRAAIRVLTVLVRPRVFDRPLVIGTLFLEQRSAALVRFQFSFTPASYLDPEIEDISVVLEQSLHEDRWWLPYRQEIEIRRRASFFEFPARSIILGRWEIDDYDFTVPMPDELKPAPDYGGLTAPQADGTTWTTPFRAAVEGAEPFDRTQFETLKAEAEGLVSRRILEGMPKGRAGTTAVSDLIRVNRVQGLALGLGASRRFDGGYQARATIGYGLSDERPTAGMALLMTRGRSEWLLEARRTVRDFGDEQIVSGVVNSLLAQEFGKDLSDYVLATELGAAFRRRIGGRWTMDLAARYEHTESVETAATPVDDEYRANPPLGSGSYWLGRLGITLAPRGALDRSDVRLTWVVEGGVGETEYGRVFFRGEATMPVPAVGGHLRVKAMGGWGSTGLPASRSFAIGGRGTLPGEINRGFGGRHVAVGHVEYRMAVPVPAIGLGPFASTGRRAILAPFAAVGWAGSPFDSLPWHGTGDLKPVVGIAAEFLQQMIRVEAATRLRGRLDLRITADIAPEWWPIL